MKIRPMYFLKNLGLGLEIWKWWLKWACIYKKTVKTIKIGRNSLGKHLGRHSRKRTNHALSRTGHVGHDTLGHTPNKRPRRPPSGTCGSGTSAGSWTPFGSGKRCTTRFAGSADVVDHWHQCCHHLTRRPILRRPGHLWSFPGIWWGFRKPKNLHVNTTSLALITTQIRIVRHVSLSINFVLNFRQLLVGQTGWLLCWARTLGNQRQVRQKGSRQSEQGWLRILFVHRFRGIWRGHVISKQGQPVGDSAGQHQVTFDLKTI